jgi:hypothetical protein
VTGAYKHIKWKDYTASKSNANRQEQEIASILNENLPRHNTSCYQLEIWKLDNVTHKQNTVAVK